MRSAHPPSACRAERLLRHLAAHGVPICLATSSHLRHYTLKTTNHGELFSLFNHRVTGGGVQGRAGCRAADSTNGERCVSVLVRLQLAARRAVWTQQRQMAMDTSPRLRERT